jgi:hypothetical protein
MAREAWREYLRPGQLSRRAVRARRKGDAIHRALSLIASLPVDDETIASLARAAAIHEGIPDAACEVEDSLRGFFMNRGFRAFFETGPGLAFYNEKEIVDAKGNTFKMDRVIVGPNLVQVIDYKTGRSAPTPTSNRWVVTPGSSPRCIPSGK